MITPQVKYKTPTTPFAKPDSVLNVSLDLKVPFAVEAMSTSTEISDAYANVDLMFVTSNASDPVVTLTRGGR